VIDEEQFYQGIDTQQLIAAQGLVRDARFMMDSPIAPRLVDNVGLFLQDSWRATRRLTRVDGTEDVASRTLRRTRQVVDDDVVR
jgi:hypothetical protein